jgi:hypothetical protein
VILSLIRETDDRMPAAAAPEEAAIGGDKRTIIFNSERQINTIPDGKLIVKR